MKPKQVTIETKISEQSLFQRIPVKTEIIDTNTKYQGGESFLTGLLIINRA